MYVNLLFFLHTFYLTIIDIISNVWSFSTNWEVKKMKLIQYHTLNEYNILNGLIKDHFLLFTFRIFYPRKK